MKRTLVVSCSLILAFLAFIIGFPPAGSAFDVTQGIPIITTVAGGGASSSVPVLQAPMTRPSIVALDQSLPSGFGLYISDEIQGRTVIRYANGSDAPVIRAGVNIGVGEIAVIAGGGDIFENIDGLPARVVDLGKVTGLAVDPSGNAIYLNAPDYRAILLVNVSASPFTTQGKTVQPGRVGGFIDTQFLYSVGLTRRPNGDIYVVGNPFGTPQQAVVARLRPNDSPLVVAGGGPGLPPGETMGPATQATLLTPIGVEFDNDGNLLIAEAGSGRTLGSIRKVTDIPNNSTISLLIENLNYPVGLSRGPDNTFYVPLGNAQQIGRFASNSNSVDIIAGDNSGAACTPNTNPTCGDGGAATSAKLNLPGSETQRNIQLAVDAQGVYLPDSNAFVPTPYAHVRFVNRTQSQVSRFGVNIGGGGINSIVGTNKLFPYDSTPAIYAELSGPRSVGADEQGNLYIADTLTDRIRFVNRRSTDVTIFAGTSSAQVVPPGQIVTINNRLGETVQDDRISTALFNSIEGIHVAANGIFVADALAGVRFPNSVGNPNSGLIRFINTSGNPVTFYPGSPNAITINPGDIKTIAGLRSGPGVDPATIGDGGPPLMAVIYPADITLDAGGNIYVADYEATRTNRVRRIAASNGVVSTVYGGGGPSQIDRPTGIATDTQNRIVVTDTFNNRILRQNSPGGSEFSVIADQSMGIQRPRGVAVAADGSIIVVSSQNYRLYRVVAPNNSLGTATIFAGTGILGFSGDGGPADQAQLALAQQAQTVINQETVGVTVAQNGAVFFADTNNGRIRQIFDEPPGPIATVSAATFIPMAPVAAESIVAGFGPNVASGNGFPQSFPPLPFELLGTSVEVQDSASTRRAAPLFSVHEFQVNYLIPPGTVTGPAKVTVRTGLGKVLVGDIVVDTVQPGLFTITSDGKGVVSGQFQRYNPGLTGVQDTFICGAQGCTALPVAFGPESEALFLIVYGTGFRFHSGLSSITATIGGTPVPVAFVGQQGFFVGLDQANIGPLPRSLAGKGTVDLVFSVGGKPANTVQVAFQ